MADYPKDLKYTKDHEWARREGDVIRVGITAYAVGQLGDVTLVDLSAAGTKVGSHGHFGDIESVKTVSELFAPIVPGRVKKRHTGARSSAADAYTANVRPVRANAPPNPPASRSAISSASAEMK